MLKTKVKQGVVAAEILKRRIREMNATSEATVPTATTTSSPPPPENCQFVL
jgi:hypothetical protein